MSVVRFRELSLRALSLTPRARRLEFQLDHAAVALFEVEEFNIRACVGRLFGADLLFQIGGAFARIFARDIDELAFRAECDHVVPGTLLDERRLTRLDNERREVLVRHFEALMTGVPVSRRSVAD